MEIDPDILARLRSLLEAIRAHEDPRRATTEWKQAFAQLKKTPASPNHVANVVAMRGVEELAALIDELGDDGGSAPDTDVERPDDETCRDALRAFKKRLKLTRLDEESRISPHDPLSHGGSSQLTAIVPPNKWPLPVWHELVRRGQIRHTGDGFYELTGK